jgi:hypothetical protein
MDDLFESVSMLSPTESRRCRTISTSSVSSAYASYSSCEIFPEIADLMVVSSNVHEFDIREQLASGRDYIRVEDVVESVPNTHVHTAAPSHYDANTMEMLVTLGFKSQDLTSSQDLWPEINLCWSSGKADTDVMQTQAAGSGNTEISCKRDIKTDGAGCASSVFAVNSDHDEGW